MKAIINSTVLYKQLQLITPVIAKNTVMPILSSVKLDFKKKKLTITGTDLETTIQTSVECDVKSPFVVLMEFSKLSDACSKIPDQPITISVNETSVTIISDDSKFKFPIPGEVGHYPTIPEDDFIFEYEADDNFFWSLVCANKCRSHDDLKVQMNAVCIDVKKDFLRVVGTDAYVAYFKTFPLKSGKPTQALVCDKFIGMIKGLSDGKVSIGPKFIKVEKNDLVIISRLKDAKFVDYTMIMPVDPEFNFKVARKNFISSIDRAIVTSNLTSKTCILNFQKEGMIKLTSQDIDFGYDGETNFVAESSVEIDQIGINGGQMMKLLDIFDSADVEMKFETPRKIIVVKPSEEKDVLCLIQPQFIND